MVFSIIDNNPEDQINIKVQEQMTKVVKFLKSQDWLIQLLLSIINWLKEIAEADGNVIANEREYKQFSQFFGVDKPFD